MTARRRARATARPRPAAPRLVLPLALLLAAPLAACGDDGDAPPGGADGPAVPDDGPVAGGDGAGAATDGGPTPDGVPATADAAAPPSDLAGDGTYDVLEQDLEIAGSAAGRTVELTLFSPSDDGASIATRGAPFPLVVISPGYTMPRTQYASYGRHLASWGFVAVTRDYPDRYLPDHDACAADLSSVIDWARGAGSPVAASVDGARIGACGHSLGGKLSFLAAARDARIRAVVGWDPVDAGSPQVVPDLMASVEVPVAVIGETLNSGGFGACAPAADNFQQFFEAAGAPALELEVHGADHFDWVDDTSCVVCGTCQPLGTIDDDDVRALTRRLDVAWMRRHLLADTAMDPHLLMADEVAAGIVSRRAR